MRWAILDADFREYSRLDRGLACHLILGRLVCVEWIEFVGGASIESEYEMQQMKKSRHTQKMF